MHAGQTEILVDRVDVCSEFNQPYLNRASMEYSQAEL